MTPYIRIKDYVINLQNVTFIRVGDDYVEFGFTANQGGMDNRIRFAVGEGLQAADLDQLKEFVFELPDPDRVILT